MVVLHVLVFSLNVLEVFLSLLASICARCTFLVSCVFQYKVFSLSADVWTIFVSL